MAKIPLFSFKGDKTHDWSGKTTFFPNATITVYWDEVPGAFLCEFEWGGAITPQRFTDGSADDPYANATHLGTMSSYKFCEDTTLVEFRGIATFPYAERVETADSAFCAPAGCNLNVAAIDVTPESFEGFADGVAVVTATGTYGGKEYSIDVDYVVWQQSNTFAGLAPGNYTLFVRDSNNCLQVRTFTVPAGRPDAYGLRFYLDYDNYLGKRFGLRVYKKFFSGVPEAVCASGEPVVIDYAFESGNRFKHLIGSQLTVQLLAKFENQFIEFFTYDEREFRIELYDTDDDSVMWTGYALPDTYGEPWVSVPRVITIFATDGVGTLKDRPFVDPAGNRYQGEMSAWEVIRLCLKPLNLRLPSLESISWYETGMDQTGQVSPLSQLTGDVAAYYSEDGTPDSCEAVLVKILSAFQAQLFQSGGYWYIHQPNWVVYQEGSIPPAPVWPPLTFDLHNPRLSAPDANGVVTGEVNIINVAGGNPADGPYEFGSLTFPYELLSSLPPVDGGGFLLTGLVPGSGGVIYLRRQGKPNEFAERGYNIPRIVGEIRTLTAGFNSVSGLGSVLVRVLGTEGQQGVQIVYETYEIEPGSQGTIRRQVSGGNLSVPEGVDYIETIAGGYQYGRSYIFRIVSVTPEVTFWADTPILPQSPPPDDNDPNTPDEPQLPDEP